MPLNLASFSGLMEIAQGERVSPRMTLVKLDLGESEENRCRAVVSAAMIVCSTPDILTSSGKTCR